MVKEPPMMVDGRAGGEGGELDVPQGVLPPLVGLRGSTHEFAQKETSPSMGHGMVRVGPRKAGVSPKGNIEGVFTGSPAMDEWSANIKSAGVVEVGWAYSASSMAHNWWVL